MRKKRRTFFGISNPANRVSLLFSLALFILLGSLSFAQTSLVDGSVTLQAPEPSFYTPSSVIRFSLDSSISIEIRERLSLEIDGIDASAFAIHEENALILDPPYPLEPGTHTLRLVEVLPDESFRELGSWEIEVRRSARFRDANASAELGPTAAHRAADHNLSDPPEETQFESGFSLGAYAEDGNWKVQGISDYLYHSQQELTSNGDEFDITSFRAQGTKGPLSLTMGHHDVGFSSLAMDGFYRRGASASLFSGTQRSQVTGFVMRTETITGFQEGLGVGDPENRVGGATWTVQPLANRDALSFSAVYLDGEGTEVGEGEGGDPTVFGGEAWSAQVSSTLLDQRLELRGEYSESRFDFDGRGIGFRPEKDEAYTFAAAYGQDGISGDDTSWAWSIGVEHQQVGTFYHSQANPGLPNDQRITQAFGSIERGGWMLEATVGRENDNVNDLAELAEIQNDSFYGSTSYTPPIPGEGKLFGQPSFALNFGYVRQDQQSTPINFFGDETDNRTRDFSASASFSYTTWSWGISHNYALFDDFAGTFLNTSQHLTDLNASFTFGQRVSLGSNVMWNDLDEGTDLDTETLTIGSSVSFVLVPDRLGGSFSGSLNKERSSDNFTDNQTVVLDGELAWTVIQPAQNTPGVNLSLSGNYQDVDDDVFPEFSSDQYQVFAGVKIAWSLGP